MLSILKKTGMLLILFIFALTGCSNEPTSEPIELEQNSAHLFTIMPSAFDDVDEVLSVMSMWKFSELDMYNPLFPNSSDFALERMVEFFTPGIIPQSVEPDLITMIMERSVTFLNYGGEFLPGAGAERDAHFMWNRQISPEYTTHLFGRGAIEERIEEHNGIIYYITIWPPSLGSNEESSGVSIGWAQHGYVFRAHFTPTFTLEEMLAFSYATPVIAWQLDGDAVSVSIQDMEDVTIVALSDGIRRSGMRQEVISSTLYQSFVFGDRLERRAIGEALYLPSGLGRSGDLERIGYRWLIDAKANRYQYVLAPGIYEFRASGATINSELLVRHFEAGEVALITDFTAEVSDPDVTEFSLIVTPDEVYDFTTEPDEPEQVTPYILVRIGEELVDKDEILYLSDDRAWALEIEVFPSDDIVTGQPTVIASDPEVIIEEWNGEFLISGSAWSFFGPSLIEVTVPTVNGDVEVSFYVSFYSVVVR